MADWKEQAACKDVETSIFFPEGSGAGSIKKTEALAKNICRRCPVVSECLMNALSNKEEHGIWGSFSSKERSVISMMFMDIDIDLCKTIVNKEIRKIKADIYKQSYGE